MSTPGKGAPVKSGWGTFISSAFEGVESKLDNMLSETEQQQQQQALQNKTAGTSAQSRDTLKPSTSHSRSSSSTRANDRLQARLAKAMAGKGGSPRESPRASMDVPSRTSTDRRSMDKPAEGMNKEGDVGAGKEKEGQARPEEDNTEANVVVTPPVTETVPPNPAAPMSAIPQNASESEKNPEPSVVPPETSTGDDKPIERQEVPEHPKPATTNDDPVPAITEAQPPGAQLGSKDLEALKTRHQEEVSEYQERIDSLQSKLQYLSKAAATDAKQAAQAAPSNSAERKLAEKDEKIALLMEEGQKLSGNEHKLRMLLKKLRAQIAEHDKQMEELRKSKDKAMVEIEALKKRSSSGEGQQKKDNETKKTLSALHTEIKDLKKERAIKEEDMKAREQTLMSQKEQAVAAAIQTHKKELLSVREKSRALEDTVATLQSEKEALVVQSRHESTEWKEKLERATERNKNTETELQLELRTMESKLEAMRAAAEEATSGTGGESQANLIRQMETLQSQYATASENWRGIEASLITKVTNLEKERDEAQKRESDMRKKARDAATKSKRFQEDLEDMQPELASCRQELEASREELATLRSSSKATEKALEQARADAEKSRAMIREYPAESDRRQQWVDETPASRVQSRPDSPLLSVPRTFSSDLVGFQMSGRSRRNPTPGSIPDGSADGLGISFGRRQSSQPPGRSGLSIAGSQNPPTPYSPFEPSSDASNMPPIPSLAEREDPTDHAPSSPRNMAQDMISVSTVGAGPSVQLVERMSAAIRRLEAEKVAAKEEMARVCSQRDEARSDMVGLMKQVEEAKSASTKVPELEKEVESLNQRYQTTLELLGEKSELVEELKADVDDVKQMYRELVERAVK